MNETEDRSLIFACWNITWAASSYAQQRSVAGLDSGFSGDGRCAPGIYFLSLCFRCCCAARQDSLLAYEEWLHWLHVLLASVGAIFFLSSFSLPFFMHARCNYLTIFVESRYSSLGSICFMM
jgi:hypothetical protein